MMRTVLYILLFFASAETFANDLDTINIYLSESTIPYRKIKKLWFPVTGSFSPSVTSQQDKIITNSSVYYFKVYDRKNRLLLEGRKTAFQEMSGLVKFYYHNGTLKRTEFYRTQSETTDSAMVLAFDGTSPWGTWTYYSKQGEVTKTVVYSVEKSQDKKELCEIIITTTFGQSNTLTSKHFLKKGCRKNNGT